MESDFLLSPSSIVRVYIPLEPSQKAKNAFEGVKTTVTSIDESNKIGNWTVFGSRQNWGLISARVISPNSFIVIYRYQSFLLFATSEQILFPYECGRFFLELHDHEKESGNGRGLRSQGSCHKYRCYGFLRDFSRISLTVLGLVLPPRIPWKIKVSIQNGLAD